MLPAGSVSGQDCGKTADLKTCSTLTLICLAWWFQTSQQKESRGVGSGLGVKRGQTEVCQCQGDLVRHVLWSGEQRRGETHQRCVLWLCAAANQPGVNVSVSLSQYDAKTRLESMSSSTSISSADLFGDGTDHKGKSDDPFVVRASCWRQVFSVYVGHF